MKHALVTLLILATVFGQAAALDVAVSASASSFAFDSNGSLNPGQPALGASVSVSDRLSDRLNGIIDFDSDPVIGNTLSARASWTSTFLEISAGPAFGVLNSSESSGEVPVLFQPGLGIGFAVFAPGFVVARANTDFALPPAAVSGGQAYLQRSELSVGFYLPNVLCSAGISQRTNTLASQTASKIRSVTDYGFYTEAFQKGSPFRVSVDFIYRVLDYYIDPDSDANRKIANLVLGGGVTWAPTADFSVFADGNGALYSFSLGDQVSGLDRFMFDLRLGVKFHTGKKATVTD